MQPEEFEEITAWLTKAARDLRAAEYLAASEEPLLDVVVYHCQQAVEKALKGYLTAQSSPFAKTHSLVALLAQAEVFDAELDGLRDHAEELTPYATRYRYPGEPFEPGGFEAEQALARATEAVRFILDRVPRPARVGASDLPGHGGSTADLDEPAQAPETKGE